MNIRINQMKLADDKKYDELLKKHSILLEKYSKLLEENQQLQNKYDKDISDLKHIITLLKTELEGYKKNNNKIKLTKIDNNKSIYGKTLNKINNKKNISNKIEIDCNANNKNNILYKK